MGLSNVYHQTDTQSYAPAAAAAKHHTPDLKAAAAKARKRKPVPHNISTWKEFFEIYEQLCIKAAEAAAAIAGSRREAMQVIGKFQHGTQHFDEESWENHREQADSYEKNSQNWIRKAQQAVYYSHEYKDR